MAEELVRPLEAGDGTGEQLLAGVSRSTEELIGAVNALGNVLEEILDRVEAVEGELEESAAIDLGEWVTWLRRSYRLTSQIPADWAQTAGTRQELHALHAAWFAAYKKDGTPRQTSAATAWHDSLDRALDRMTRHNSRDEDKTGVEPPPWAASGEQRVT